MTPLRIAAFLAGCFAAGVAAVSLLWHIFIGRRISRWPSNLEVP